MLRLAGNVVNTQIDANNPATHVATTQLISP